MASKTSKTKTNDQDHEASSATADPTLAEHKAAPATAVFKRRAAVTVPTLKLEVGSRVFIKVIEAIKTVQKVENDPQTGQPVTKDLDIVRVVDLKTGELMQMVVGAALKGEWEKYKGGNQNYVGLCYEVNKLEAKPGKRAKQYTIYEVDAPGEGAV